MKAAEAKDWPAALTAAQGAGAVGGDVILWQWLRDGQGRLGDYEGFIARRPDWPGLALLREKGEVAVARSTDPARVVAYFATDKPKTGAGAVALVRRLVALGRSGEAEAEAFRAWTTLKFEAADETAMLAMMGAPLAVAHEVRLDRILWDGGRKAEAERMLPRVSKDWQRAGAWRGWRCGRIVRRRWIWSMRCRNPCWAIRGWPMSALPTGCGRIAMTTRQR